MNVKLVAISQPHHSTGCRTAEQLIAYCARVSNPSNQNNNETASKLLNYCIRNKHWSIFEQVSLTMEINTTRDIARQILRHKSFSFQEFCVAGDTMISFDSPHAVKSGKKGHRKMRIEELWRKWEHGANPIPHYISGNPIKIPQRKKIEKMLIRVYDEEQKKFTTSNITGVFQTGIKPIFEIELYNGKKIKATKEHKVLTESGFMSFEDALGLSLIGNVAVMSNPDVAIGCNGELAYRNKNWLEEKKKESIENGFGLKFLAKEAGCSIHTIGKWLRKHNMRYTKKEVAQYTTIWNKGKFGYKLGPRSLESIERSRKSAKRGPDSNLWRGGVDRGFRAKVADWGCSIRREMLLKADFMCNDCGSHNKLQLHHKKPVYSNPELAFDKENIQVLCKECHDKIHKINGDTKVWSQTRRKNVLVVSWSKVRSVKYLGEEMTYDLEVNHRSHNYIANGIVVHNSQRYADPTQLEYEIRETRLQDPKNRQNSIELDDRGYDELDQQWRAKQEQVVDEAKMAYKWAVQNGIAKEQARVVLPEGNTSSRLFMSGTLRSWIHFCEVRRGSGTQKEHRLIANECWYILCDNFSFLKDYD